MRMRERIRQGSEASMISKKELKELKADCTPASELQVGFKEIESSVIARGTGGGATISEQNDRVYIVSTNGRIKLRGAKSGDRFIETQNPDGSYTLRPVTIAVKEPEINEP